MFQIPFFCLLLCALCLLGCEDRNALKHLEKVGLIRMELDPVVYDWNDDARRSTRQSITGDARLYSVNNKYALRNAESFFDWFSDRLPVIVTHTGSASILVPQADSRAKTTLLPPSEQYYVPKRYRVFEMPESASELKLFTRRWGLDAIMRIRCRFFIDNTTIPYSEREKDPFERQNNREVWQLRVTELDSSQLYLVASVLVVRQDGRVLLNRDIVVETDSDDVSVELSEVLVLDMMESKWFDEVSEKFFDELAYYF